MDHFLFSGSTRKRLTIRFIPLDSSAEAEKNLRNQIWGGKDRGNQETVQVFWWMGSDRKNPPSNLLLTNVL
jgi:hypothetical protein